MCAFPVLVIAPRHYRGPLDAFRDTKPAYAITSRGVRNRCRSSSSATRVTAVTNPTTPQGLQDRNHHRVPARPRRFRQLRLHPTEPILRLLHRPEGMAQDNLLARPRELEALEPLAVLVTPQGFTPAGGRSPRRSRNLLKRSPGFVGIKNGATTTQRIPSHVR